jgi:hypothetical protein
MINYCLLYVFISFQVIHVSIFIPHGGYLIRTDNLKVHLTMEREHLMDAITVGVKVAWTTLGLTIHGFYQTFFLVFQ